MNYQLITFTIKGLTLDDELKEIHIQVDIMVGIEGADPRFQINNSNIDFAVKGFLNYDELSAQIKDKSAQWVADNYVNV